MLSAMSSNQVSFCKYQGHGDDYVVIDNRKGTVSDLSAIAKGACRRSFSVGANGVIVLGTSQHLAFKLELWNTNGESGTLCGNGTRCGLAFARDLGLFKENSVTFDASDGVHTARFIPAENKFGMTMKDKQFSDIQCLDDRNYCINVGRIEHVRFLESFDGFDIIKTCAELEKERYQNQFDTCLNFAVEGSDGMISVRTLQLGLGEINGCGTGCSAVALTTALRHIRESRDRVQNGSRTSFDMKMSGGVLTVSFDVGENSFTNVELIGQANLVYDGVYYF